VLHPDQASARTASKRSIRERRVAIARRQVEPAEHAANITVWPAPEHNAVAAGRDMRGRLSIVTWAGAATISLFPSVEEARALIAALEWAIQASEVPA
jgi:hypothetical protein